MKLTDRFGSLNPVSRAADGGVGWTTGPMSGHAATGFALVTRLQLRRFDNPMVIPCVALAAPAAVSSGSGACNAFHMGPIGSPFGGIPNSGPTQ